jgi:stress-induced morphogen
VRIPHVWTEAAGTSRSPSPGASGGRPSRPRSRRSGVAAISQRTACGLGSGIPSLTSRERTVCTRSLPSEGMPTADELKRRIEDALPGAEVHVEDLTGGGDHFRAEVASERFDGLTRIEQHKLVYDVFGEEIGGPIHALSIKTSSEKGAR